MIYWVSGCFMQNLNDSNSIFHSPLYTVHVKNSLSHGVIISTNFIAIVCFGLQQLHIDCTSFTKSPDISVLKEIVKKLFFYCF